MRIRYFLGKEFKRYPLFYGLIFLTLTLGSLGILGIGSLAGQIQAQLDSKSRELLTSDFSLSSRRNFYPEEINATKEVLKSFNPQSYFLFDVYSMIKHLNSGQTRLVEIRGVEETFPFYGELKTNEGLWDPKKIYASKELWSLWNMTSGDRIQLGKTEVEIKGLILEDTSLGIRGASLAPRLYVPLKVLQESGLLGFGSIGTFQMHFKLGEISTEKLKELRSLLFKKIPDPMIKMLLPEDSSQQTGRAMELISNFMSLASLVGFLLSLVGVFYLYQSQFFFRLKDFILLRLHGLKKTDIYVGLLVQVFFLFFTSFLFQMLILYILRPAFERLLEEYVGLKLEQGMEIFPFLKHLPFLFLLILSSLLPLINGLLRTSTQVILKEENLSSGKFYYYDFIPFLILFWIYSWYLSNSLRNGSLFFLSISIIFSFSFFLIKIFQKLIEKLMAHRRLNFISLEFSLAIKNLSRSGHKLSLSFISLVLGVCLIVFILQLDSLLRRELQINNKRPDLFLFDIQEDQLESFSKFAVDQDVQLDALTPMIRGRLLKINGVEFKRPKSQVNLRNSSEDNEELRSRNSAINMTFRSYLTDSEKIVEGKEFSNASSTLLAPISLEKRWAQRMRIKLDDKLIFDVQGVEVEGVVVNLREVKWTDFYPNFFVTVAPGHIDEAPKTYLAVARFKSADKKINFQRASVDRFSNISFIDVEEAINKLSGIFQKSQFAVRVISLMSVFIGLVIFYAITFDQIYRRFYDFALLKTLGLEAKNVTKQLFLEFGIFFSLALFTGMFLGRLLAQLLAQEIFKLSFYIDVISLFTPLFILLPLCGAIIFIVSWRVVRASPRALLQEK